MMQLQIWEQESVKTKCPFAQTNATRNHKKYIFSIYFQPVIFSAGNEPSNDSKSMRREKIQILSCGGKKYQMSMYYYLLIKIE